MKFIAVDYWVAGYALLVSAMALVFAQDQTSLAGSHALHLGVVCAVVGVARWVPRSGRLALFLRYGYPILLYTFLYRDTGHYIFLIFDFWFDPAVLVFEEWILGLSLTAKLAHFASKGWLEFFMFGYFAYYLMLPLGVVTMWLLRQTELFRRMNIAVAASFFVSYAMFLLFPLEGPRYAMHDLLPPLEGVIFYPLVMAIQDTGAIHGGCMPSSHTAVAWVITYYLYLAKRTLGRLLIGVSVLLSVGCVWGRFHYVTDVVLGLVIFVATTAATEWYNRAHANHTPSDTGRLQAQVS